MSMTLTGITGRGPWDFETPACRGMDTELFFVASVRSKGEYSELALAACRRCPHQIECAQYALEDWSIDGLWGGLTPEQRRVYRRNRNAARTQEVAS